MLSSFTHRGASVRQEGLRAEGGAEGGDEGGVQQVNREEEEMETDTQRHGDRRKALRR